MNKKYSLIALGASVILLLALSSAAFAATNNQDAAYCRSPLLYATNIRETCEQYGADGMASLYQRSEFITKLKTSNDARVARQRDIAS